MDRGQTDEDSHEPRQNNDTEAENAASSRRVLRADREKLRRDKLNEQFLELGNLLDPDRPKNDKGTIITDAIQVLKDLNSEVHKLKADHAVLREESQELTQEKNEIREEKASLKSNIQHLKASIHHQQAQGFMVPWPNADSQVVMAPSYPFPIAVPMHQTQSLPLFTNHVPYLAPVVPSINQSVTLNASNSNVSGPGSSSSRSCNEQRSSRCRTGNSNDVATELELKVPGTAAPKEFIKREEKPTRK